MSDEQSSAIIYTFTDEAPLLATYSFLPIIEAYADRAGVAVETSDAALREMASAGVTVSH